MGSSFKDIGFTELLKQNRRFFYSSLGIPPVQVGDTDGMNYANSEIQNINFWEQTIVPMQRTYCEYLSKNPELRKMLKAGERLCFDNSDVKYLDPFAKLLKEDAQLTTVLTINERRARLGFEPHEDEAGDALPSTAPAAQVNTDFVQNSFSDPATKETIDFLEPAASIEDKLWRRYEDTIKFVASNPLSSKNSTKMKFMAGAESFVKSWNKDMMKIVERNYDSHTESVVKSPKFGKIKKVDLVAQRMRDLRKLSMEYIETENYKQRLDYYDKYTTTATDRIHKYISDQLMEDPEISEGELSERIWKEFGVNRRGVANTIARTELGAALALAEERQGKDFQSLAQKMRKTWDAKLDSGTRPTHAALDGDSVYWTKGETASDLMEIQFPGSELRFPRDPLAPMDETINCRCAIQFEIIEFDEDL
jgi:hypothetical protein